MKDILLVLIQSKLVTLKLIQKSKAFQEVLSRSLNCIMIVSTTRAASDKGKVSRTVFQGLLWHASYQHYILKTKD